jgi:hypothetical protein
VAKALLEKARGIILNQTKEELVQTGGVMSIAALVLLTMLTGSPHAARQARASLDSIQQSKTSSSQINGSEIKITIATGGVPYRPAKDTYSVGEPIPLVITMTNTGSQPVYVCESATLYQDRPQLLRNGEPVAYASFRQSMMQTVEKDKTCDKETLPQQVLLRPNEPTVVDWFNLAEGPTSLYDDGWYESLPPGKYTLTSRRRLNCCDGQLLESNTISFVVVP